MSQRRDAAIKATEQAKAIHNLSPEEVEIVKKFALDAMGYNDELETEVHNYIKDLKEISKKYGDRLVSLRACENLSRARASEIFEIPPTTLARLEKGTNEPSVTVALAIAKYYGKTVEELFGIAEKTTIK